MAVKAKLRKTRPNKILLTTNAARCCSLISARYCSRTGRRRRRHGQLTVGAILRLALRHLCRCQALAFVDLEVLERRGRCLVAAVVWLLRHCRAMPCSLSETKEKKNKKKRQKKKQKKKDEEGDMSGGAGGVGGAACALGSRQRAARRHGRHAPAGTEGGAQGVCAAWPAQQTWHEGASKLAHTWSSLFQIHR